MAEIKYQLADSISVFSDFNGHLVVILGQKGQVCTMKYSDRALQILECLRQPVAIEDVIDSFPDVMERSLRNGIELLLSYGIVEIVDSRKRDVSCLVIGCGSIGSHIFRQISMLSLGRIVLVDNDVVDNTNVYRQDYYPSEVGRRKVDVLATRPSNAESIIPIDSFVHSRSELVGLIERYHANLVIQAADVPTTEDLAHWVNEAADRCGIPYIINPGYLGGAMSLPEFFYPNLDYGYSSSHRSVHGRRLLQFSKSKFNFRMCSALGSLLAQQVDDYRHQKIPRRYGEKGYFDMRDFAWRTERIVETPAREPDMTRE